MSPDKKRGPLAAFVLAWTFAAASPPSAATSVAPMNIVDLMTHAHTIVVGRVEKVTDGFDAKGLPYTEVTMTVNEPIRGVPGKTQTFRQFGLDKPRTMPSGRVFLGGRPEGFPSWTVGETAMVFLYPEGRQTGMRTTVGLHHGKLNLANGVAANANSNHGLFTNVSVRGVSLAANEQALLAAKGGPVDEKALRGFVRKAVKDQWIESGRLAHDKR